MQKKNPNKVTLRFTDRILEMIDEKMQQQGQANITEFVYDCIKAYLQGAPSVKKTTSSGSSSSYIPNPRLQARRELTAQLLTLPLEEANALAKEKNIFGEIKWARRPDTLFVGRDKGAYYCWEFIDDTTDNVRKAAFKYVNLQTPSMSEVRVTEPAETFIKTQLRKLGM